MKHHRRISPILAFISTLDSICFTSSQESPYYDLVQFDPIPADTEVPRQDICDRVAALERGEVVLADALKGLDLHPAIAASEYVVLDDEGRLDEEYPGLLPTLLDKIAEEAGFRWRNSFGLTWIPEMTEGRTFPDLLEWTVKHYDVCIDWWPNDFNIAQRNIALSPHWYDASIVLVWIPPEPNNDQFFLSFFKPFSPGVWFLTAGTLVISGVIFLIFENMDRSSEEKLSWNWLVSAFREHLFLSAITFTGNFSYTPRSNAARLFSWSLTFLSLVWAASYTANLASFLVAKNRPPFVINTIEDAIRKGPLCVSDLTNAQHTISEAHPKAEFVTKESEAEMFQALNAGECVCAATTMVSWSANRQSLDSNPDCKLKKVIGTVANLDGSFGFLASLGRDKCTTLIRDVFQIHMLKMQDEGFIAKAWEYEFQRTSTNTCESEVNKLDATTMWDDLEEETFTLGLKDMGGIFVFHYCLTGVALLFAGLGCFVDSSRYKRKRAIEKEDGLPQASGEQDVSNNSIDESMFQDAMSTQSDNFEDNPGGVGAGQNLDTVITYLKDLQEKQRSNDPQGRRRTLQMTKRKNSAKNNHNSWATTRGFGGY